jgi:hypothetical protein
MAKMHGDETTVKALPDCDFCLAEKKRKKEKARYDGRTRQGPWANMCVAHFKAHGIGVGVGKGQRLWLPSEKHAPGEVPIVELPPHSAAPQEALDQCSVCGLPWFVRVLEYIAGKSYCPKCLRDCFPLRKDGPYTFGDIVAVTYPASCENPGVYIGRVLTIPEQNVLEIRFEYDEAFCEDVHLAMDGFGGWWDLDNQVPSPEQVERLGKDACIRVRFGVEAEAIGYEKLRRARIGYRDEGRPTESQLRPWGGQPKSTQGNLF